MYWLHADGLKLLLTMNPMEKLKFYEQNFRKHDISYGQQSFCVNIRTSHLTKHSYNVFEEYKFLTKTTITKQVIDEKKLFRSEIMSRKEVNDEIQRSVSFIKDELQSVIEKNIQEGSKKENSYWLHADGLKLFLTMNPMEKLKSLMNKTS